VIAEAVASGAVVISARSDLSYPDADEAVVQTLAAEAGMDPAMVGFDDVEVGVLLRKLLRGAN